MSAFGEAAETEPPTADPVTVRLDEILDELEAVVADNTPVRDAARIDRIARLEKLRAATADFRSPNRCGSPSPRLPSSSPLMFIRLPSGRGIAEQIGLACRISPVIAARRLNTARSLWFELPDTYRQLIAGELSQRLAEKVVSETRHLDPGQRCQVDAQLAARAISEMGFKTAVACIRKAAYQADRQGYLQRGRTERHHRRVGVRPAPDTMAMLTGYLPLEQGIACYAALRHQADTAVATGDGRTRDQIMADTHSLSRSRIAHESAAVVVSRRGKSASARSSSVRRCAIPDARGSGGTDYRASTSHRCQCGAAAADATGFLAQHGECECRSHPRLRAAARQARPTNPRQQSGAQMVAAPVHRAQRVSQRLRANHRRGSNPPLLRRLARQAHQTP
jgi:Domain of unknown function (DUF222)